MFIIKFFLKLLLVPVWLILTFICLVIGLFVTIYGTGRSIAALILSALFLGVIFCYHDWIQAILLIVIYIFLFGFTELPSFVSEKQMELLDNWNPKPFDILDDSSCISFYAAECSEFPVLGEVHYDLTLTEAFEAYDRIPDNRMNGIKEIGFNLKDGSDWEGLFPLVTGEKIDKELINSIPGFRENKLVQEAVSRAEKILERRHQEKTRSDASKTDMKKEEKKQAKKENMCL